VEAADVLAEVGIGLGGHRATDVNTLLLHLYYFFCFWGL
jgi:hypothetical protein